MKQKSIFRWFFDTALLAVFIVGLFYVGVVVFARSTLETSPVADKSDLTNDAEWLMLLDEDYENRGLTIYSLEIVENDPDLQGRVLFIASRDTAGRVDKPTPYNLISGIHIVAFAGWTAEEIDLEPIDWIQIEVQSEDAASYGVLIEFDDLLKLFNGEITEEYYFQQWQITGDIPDFLSAPVE